MIDMMKAINRRTNEEVKVERIECGFRVLTEEGTKKLKESTFKRYYKITGETVEENKKEVVEEPKVETTQEKKEVVDPKKRAKLVEKISNILDLSKNNTSKEEAMAAALKAQRLMVKYGIQEDEIVGKEVEMGDSVYNLKPGDPNNHSWKYELAKVVSQNFRCKSYVINKNEFHFHGYKQDAEIAKGIFEYLFKVGTRFGNKEYRRVAEETGSGRGVFNNFIAGFLMGVTQAFNKQSAELLVITPKEVSEAYEEKISTYQKDKNARNLSVKTVMPGIIKKGVEKGKELVQSRRIEE
jgi:hypothetical protein